MPDFFSAVPVWYFWTSREDTEQSTQDWKNSDPNVHPTIQYFCEMFPNENWADVFQMFNRRIRTLGQYKGDIIPPSVLRRIREAVTMFDHVAIMTPYHDVAGRDWEDIKWLRSIDPYVVGFKKGIPYFFILARFSDSGTFPLFNELVGDTINFLKNNREKLLGFNQCNNPYWFVPNSDSHTYPGQDLGNHLQGVTDTLIQKFEEGKLFDWLRGEESETPATTAK